MSDHDKKHTVRRYDGELRNLHFLLLDMGARVTAQIEATLAAFAQRDSALAERVVAADAEIDHLESAADREIGELIARRSPVGSDLRLVLAIAKGISDLERIGDEAAKLASLAVQLFGPEALAQGGRLTPDIRSMGAKALKVLKNALATFEDWNLEEARKVIGEQAEVEAEFESELRKLMTFAMADCREVGLVISMMLAIKSLELIGHHACNLAEHVVFKVKGDGIAAA